MPASYRNFITWLQQAKAQGKSGTGAGILALPTIVATPISYILRMLGAEYVAPTSDVVVGGTASQISETAQPVVSGTGATFDGVDDTLTITFDTPIDLVGKTIAMVFTPVTMATANTTVLSFQNSGGTTVLEVQARTTPAFRGRIRNSGFGFTPNAFVDVAGTRNQILTYQNEPVLVMLDCSATSFCATVQGDMFSRTQLSGGVQLVSSLRLASDVADFANMTFHELAVFSRNDIPAIQQEVERMVSAWGVASAPVWTTGVASEAVNYGDSIAAGVAQTSAWGFLEQAQNNLLAATNRTTSTLAGACFCPVGETDPTIIDFAFPNISNTYAVPVNTAFFVVHYGINDFRTANAPLGSVSSADELSVLGCMKAGITNIRTRNPGIPIIFTSPFYYDLGSGTNAAGYSLQELRDGIEAVCALSSDTHFVDMFTGLGIDTASASTYLADGLHPNDAGHTLGGVRLTSRLSEILV